MNKGSILVLSAMVFGGAGFASGYYYSKKKHLLVADKEIESVKKAYAKHYNSNEKVEPSVNKQNERGFSELMTVTPSTVGNNDRLDYEKKYREIKEQKDIVEKSNYASVQPQTFEINPMHASMPNITTLSTEEFDMSSNSCRTLYYYEKNGMITDIDNNVCNDYFDHVGEMSAIIDRFNKTKSDVIYIRNNDEEMDYEICMLHEDWNDVASPAQKALLLNVSNGH